MALQAKVSETAFWTITLGVYTVFSVIALVLLFFPINFTVSDPKEVIQIYPGIILGALIALHIAVSFEELGPSEIGAHMFFGRPIRHLECGLAFVPFGITTVEVFSNLIQQAELPAEPEKVYRGSPADPDAKDIPPGKYAAIRILFGAPSPTSGDAPEDPYNNRMAVEVTPIIRYQIEDAAIFVQTIGTWEKMRTQVEDEVVAKINEEFCTMSPAEALKKIGEVSKKLTEIADEMVGGWGCKIHSVTIKPFSFSHKLNEAVLAVPEAERQKRVQILKAEGDKQAKILVGQGEASAEKAVIEARGEAMKKMYQDLGVDGAAVLAAETARGITNNPGQKTIIAGSGGFKDLATVGTVLGETMKKE